MPTGLDRRQAVEFVGKLQWRKTYKRHNTYIALQAATAAAAALCVTDRVDAQTISRRISPQPRDFGYDEQPYASLVCRLMVFTLITWITTQSDGMLSWPGWMTHSRHFTHKVVTYQPEITQSVRQRPTL